MRKPTRLPFRRRLIRLGEVSKSIRSAAVPGYWRQHVHKESARNTGSPEAWSAMTNWKPVLVVSQTNVLSGIVLFGKAVLSLALGPPRGMHLGPPPHQENTE